MFVTEDLIAVLIAIMIFMIIPIIFCSVLAKKTGLPVWYGLLGIFQAFGVFALVFIIIFKGIKNAQKSYQKDDLDYESNYNNNQEYHSQENHWHAGMESGDKEVTVDKVVDWHPANDCNKQEDVVYVNGERIEREYIICKNCGGKMRKGTSFCTFCGENL